MGFEIIDVNKLFSGSRSVKKGETSKIRIIDSSYNGRVEGPSTIRCKSPALCLSDLKNGDQVVFHAGSYNVDEEISLNNGFITGMGRDTKLRVSKNINIRGTLSDLDVILSGDARINAAGGTTIKNVNISRSERGGREATSSSFMESLIMRSAHALTSDISGFDYGVYVGDHKKEGSSAYTLGMDVSIVESNIYYNGIGVYVEPGYHVQVISSKFIDNWIGILTEEASALIQFSQFSKHKKTDEDGVPYYAATFINSNIEIKSCIFRSNYGAVAFSGGNVDISENSHIYANEYNHNNGSYAALLVMTNGYLQLDSDYVYSNGIGIGVVGGEVHLSNSNVLYNKTGIHAYDGGRVYLDGANTVSAYSVPKEDHPYNIFLGKDSYAQLDGDNTISDAYAGLVVCRDSKADVNDSTFLDNEYGVMLAQLDDSGAPPEATFRGNYFNRNVIGVYAQDGSPDLGMSEANPGLNVFGDSEKVNLLNGYGDVYAIGNHWHWGQNAKTSTAFKYEDHVLTVEEDNVDIIDLDGAHTYLQILTEEEKEFLQKAYDYALIFQQIQKDKEEDTKEIVEFFLNMPKE